MATVGDKARVDDPHCTLEVVKDVAVTGAPGRNPLEGCKLNEGTDVGRGGIGPLLVVFVLNGGATIEGITDVVCMEGNEDRLAVGDGARAAASVVEDDMIGGRLDVRLADGGVPGMKTAGVVTKKVLLLLVLLLGISMNANDDADDVVDSETGTSGICGGGRAGTDGVDTSTVLLVSALKDDANVGDAVRELCDTTDDEVVMDVLPLLTAVVGALVDALVDALDTVMSKVDTLLEESSLLEDMGRLTVVVAVTISLTVMILVALLCRLTLRQRFSYRASGGPTAQCHGRASMPETCQKQ